MVKLFYQYYEVMYGGENMAQFILNFGTRLRWAVNFMLWLHYSWQKSPQYLFSWRLAC